MVTAEQYNLPVLYSYCNSCFMRDVHGEFGLINVHMYDTLPAMCRTYAQSGNTPTSIGGQ